MIALFAPRNYYTNLNIKLYRRGSAQAMKFYDMVIYECLYRKSAVTTAARTAATIPSITVSLKDQENYILCHLGQSQHCRYNASGHHHF